ncbi:MAG: MBL fold metallo-hydrolase [Nocardioidaceae bacterium]|nr:MBL fold metallo-hydrolase [Nocardioidaceae bacterium]
MTEIERVVTSGTFSLDGETFDVDNNVWLVGNGAQVAVVDPGHDAEPILAAVGQREVVAIVCTHGHDDHISAVGDLWDVTRAPVWLHPADRMLWDVLYHDRAPDRDLHEGATISAGGVELRILHTPGHSPGSSCLYVPDLDTLLSGDTLFQGGPGATGRSFSDRPTIEQSIRERLLSLPADTAVLTGHGDSTTIGEEAARPPFG